MAENPEVKLNGCRNIAPAPCEDLIELCPLKGLSSVCFTPKGLQQKVATENKLGGSTSVTKWRENKFTHATPTGGKALHMMYHPQCHRRKIMSANRIYNARM